MAYGKIMGDGGWGRLGCLFDSLFFSVMWHGDTPFLPRLFWDLVRSWLATCVQPRTFVGAACDAHHHTLIFTREQRLFGQGSRRGDGWKGGLGTEGDAWEGCRLNLYMDGELTRTCRTIRVFLSWASSSFLPTEE